jgi:hypothetical protein
LGFIPDIHRSMEEACNGRTAAGQPFPVDSYRPRALATMLVSVIAYLSGSQ